jgi:putative ABC transport system permease protein
MNLQEVLRVALRALGANKLRAALTMLGMIIGVGSVIALMAIGAGVQASISGQISGMGSNLLTIMPGAQTRGGVRQAAGSAPTLTYEDALAIVSSGRVPQALAIAPEASSSGQVVAAGQNVAGRLTGVTADHARVRNLKLAEGQFFSTQNQDARSPVVVLGASIRKTLFGTSDALGKTIRVNQVSLRVIGVLEEAGQSMMGGGDDAMYLPITTLQTRFSGARTATGGRIVSTIFVQLADDTQQTAEAAAANITALLRERHDVKEDDFTMMSQQELQEATAQITGVLTLFLGSIAGISLVVGGIGIMNIMLVSVTERTREIGIRKAIGAKRSDILLQFLLEATVVSVLGGAAGIALGAGGASLISLVNLGGTPMQAVVSPSSVLLAVSVSAGIGLFFGVFPAVKASRLNPIEALRYE